MRAVCANRKSRTTCTKDDHCEWKDGVCVKTLQNQVLQICKYRRGKEDILKIMQELRIPPPSGAPSIGQLCSHIELYLPKLWEGKPIEAVKRDYEKVVARVPPRKSVALAPISSDLPISESNDRVKTHRLVQKALRKDIVSQKTQFVCSLTEPLHVLKRIGTSSVYGKVYMTRYDSTTPHSYLAAKLMKNIKMNRNEISMYEKLNNVVTRRQSPHMPLVFHSQECKANLVVLTELAKGDLRAWLESGGVTLPQVLSMISQVVLALQALEFAGLTHQDLHWGNILYHEQPQNDWGYIHYSVKGNDVYVRHCGLLWTLWDFGLMRPYRHPSEVVQQDLSRILHFGNWARDHTYPKLPISLRWLQGFICACQKANSVMDIWNLLSHASEKQGGDRIFVVNPDEEWLANARISSKHDMDTLWVERPSKALR
jgi:hypothetical protein